MIDSDSAARFAARLRIAGAIVRDELYSDIGHKALIAAFAGLLTFLAPARDATLRFIEAHRVCGD